MLNWFLSSSVLIAALLLLRQLLKGRLDPRLTYALWLLCALRVLIPVSLFSAPVTVSGLADKADLSGAVETVREALSPKEPLTTSLPQSSDITLEEYAESRKDSGLHIYDAAPFTEEELSEIRKDNPAFYRDTADQPIKLTVERLIGQYTFWGWIYRAGFFVLLLALLVCNFRFARRLKASRRPYDGPLPVPCKLPVYVVDDLPSPCLFGLFRPAIYLNRAAVESGQLKHILTHELTHCRHLDHWWAVVRCACLAMQWFNPLVWVAVYLSRQDCESACDASVVRALGEEERLGYGRTLVDMIAAGQRRGSALFDAATTMTGGARSIRSRITLIARKPKMTALTLTSALLIAALAVGCTFGGAKEDIPSLSPYFGVTYSMTDDQSVGLAVLSYAPTKDSIGEITITDNFFGALDGDNLDWGENVTNPVYTHIDFDQDTYGRSDLFYPTLEEFFGAYSSITVYEIENAAKPLHLLLLDGELWMAINVGKTNCYILRLEKAETVWKLADAVYQSIVGTYESRDCYLTVESEEFGETRIHITEQNGYNLPNSLRSYHWSEGEPCECAVTTTLTLSSPDGQTRLVCSEGCDSVSLTADGKSYLLQSEDTLFNTLLRAANFALVTGLDDGIVIDGGITDYGEVVEQFARQFAANIAALPGWAASAPEGVAYRESGVERAYFGEGTENFNSYYSLYFSSEMGDSDWQAGGGMEEVPDGEYAGWWIWIIGADFARNEDGDWVCTGLYSGRDGLTYPTPLDEASIEELIHYLGHTTGYDHEYLVPYYICQQPASQLDELEAALLAAPERNELCTALGRFLRDYGSDSDIQLTYEVLSGTLPRELADPLTEGYGA